jgi:hypothetical protein
MPTPYESATLNLKLFDMRREPELRRARSWFITEFHPESIDDYFAAMGSDKNAWMRMVIGYWDMAASMVSHGAIDRDMFLAAHTEVIGAFAKAHPFLAEIRARISPLVLMHVEALVMSMPNAEEEMAKRRARLKGMWQARQAAAAVADAAKA